MNAGWVCPVCGAGVAPGITEHCATFTITVQAQSSATQAQDGATQAQSGASPAQPAAQVGASERKSAQIAHIGFGSKALEPQTLTPPTKTEDQKHMRKSAQSSANALAPEDDPFFMAFWKAYPLHRDRARAYVVWRKLAQSGASPAQIIEGARNYAAWCKRNNVEARHIKYPQGWLSGERWLDEIEAAPETPPEQIVGTPEYAARREAEEQRAMEAG